MEQGQQLQKYISVDPLPPAVVFEEYDSPYSLSIISASQDEIISAQSPTSNGVSLTYVSLTTNRTPDELGGDGNVEM